MVDRTIEILRRLSDLERLEPLEVAALLRRRAVLLAEDETGRAYRLDGAAAIPLIEVRATWLERKNCGWVTCEMHPRVRIPIPEVTKAMGEFPGFAPLPADYGDPDPLHRYVWRKRAGELHAKFRGFEEEQFVLHSFAVSGLLTVEWAS